LLPAARPDPFTVSVAVEPVSAEDPRVALPSKNVTMPVGAALPPEALTVAVKTVFPDDAIAVGLAERARVVATVAGVTVTVVFADDAEKLLVGKKVASIVLAPVARLAPLTVRVAVDPETAAEPRVVPPSVKVKAPSGAVLPLAGLIVAVKSVLAEDAIAAGFAERVVVVAIGGAVTATTNVAEAFEKLPDAA